MNERQGKLLAMMERKQKLMSGAPEDLRENIFQESRVLDERISAEEVDVLEKKQAMKELLKERSRTEVEEWKGAVATESGVAQKVAAGFRSSEAEGDLFLSEVGVLQRDSEEDQRSFGQVKAPPQKINAVIRVEPVETRDYVSAPSVTGCLEQIMEAEDEKDMEELGFIPECGQRAMLGPAHV